MEAEARPSQAGEGGTRFTGRRAEVALEARKQAFMAAGSKSNARALGQGMPEAGSKSYDGRDDTAGGAPAGDGGPAGSDVGAARGATTPMCRDPRTGRALDTDALQDLVRAMMQRIRENPMEFGIHSLLIGGATALYAAGRGHPDGDPDDGQMVIRPLQPIRAGISRASSRLVETCWQHNGTRPGG